jgi:hypothetical protein
MDISGWATDNNSIGRKPDMRHELVSEESESKFGAMGYNAMFQIDFLSAKRKTNLQFLNTREARRTNHLKSKLLFR